jgi:two-component system response regulator RegX3
MDILLYLDAHSQRPVSRDELLHKVWGYANGIDLETRTVDIHIAKLRRKLEPDSSQPRYLITVRGAGYRLMTATV